MDIPELHIRVVSARGLADVQTFGTQDPYAKLSSGNREFKTKVHDNGGANPVWNEKFVFSIYNPQMEQIRLKIKNKNTLDSKLIGECRLQINTFAHGNVVDEWFAIHDGSKRTGEVNLRLQLIGPSQNTPSYQTTQVPLPASYAPSAPPPEESSYPGARHQAQLQTQQAQQQQTQLQAQQAQLQAQQAQQQQAQQAQQQQTQQAQVVRQQQEALETQKRALELQRQQLAAQQQQFNQQRQMVPPAPVYQQQPVYAAPPRQVIVQQQPQYVHQTHGYSGGHVAAGAGGGFLGGMLLGAAMGGDDGGYGRRRGGDDGGFFGGDDGGFRGGDDGGFRGDDGGFCGGDDGGFGGDDGGFFD